MLLIPIFVSKGTGQSVTQSQGRRICSIALLDIKTHPKAILIKSIFDWLGVYSLINGIE